MIDFRGFADFLELAVTHYQSSAPTVAGYLDGPFVRFNESPDKVVLSEIICVESLMQCGQWEQPNYAANRIYHLLHRLGRDTAGMIGF